MFIDNKMLETSINNNLQTLTEQYNKVWKDVINKSQEIGGFEAYKNKLNPKIIEQIK